MTPPIKAVFFDLDDTLWPIEPVIARAETILAEWLLQNEPGIGRDYSIEAMRQRRMALLKEQPQHALDLGQLRLAVLQETYAERGLDPARAEAAMQAFAAARNEVVPFPDVHPVLERLVRRLPLGAITNGVADLHATGMASYFSHALAARHFGRLKPDPGIFLAACAALEVAPEHALYVGDDPVLDVEGAQNAGLRAAWLNRPEHRPRRQLPEHIRPHVICTSLLELEAWLE